MRQQRQQQNHQLFFFFLLVKKDLKFHFDLLIECENVISRPIRLEKGFKIVSVLVKKYRVQLQTLHPNDTASQKIEPEPKYQHKYRA